MHYLLKNNFKLFTLLLLIAGMLSACQQKPREHHDEFLVFGTIISITLLDVDDETAQLAFREMREDLKLMHQVWHPWEPGSLTRMNSLLPHKVEFSASPSVLELVVLAKQLAKQSQQLFNPAIGQLVALWGFHSNTQPGVAPSDEEIKKLVAQNPSLEDLTINGVRVNNKNSAVKIDLGGIAKGFAIDRLLTYLKQKGIHHALINTGGDLKVIGKHFDRPWKVAIRDPRVKEAVVATLDLHDNEAAFTSGDYERFFKNKSNIETKQDQDQHLHHIIDPRTGYPATGTQSVTVLHDNAATADAAATALFIAGPKQWIEIAKSMKIKYVLLIDAQGKVHMSKAMAKRVNFTQQREVISVIDL